jgi:4-carboxymuconolactone decarboxylase
VEPNRTLSEAITHLAFYTGWPKAFAAMTVAKSVFRDHSGAAPHTDG